MSTFRGVPECSPEGDPMAKEKRQPIRVLLVDDEPAFLRVLAKRLAVRGMQPQTALSGSEAVRLLRDNVYDVALLDLKMMGMDGLETLRMFAVMAPELKVILLTGHGGEREAREALRLGAVDYLIKPCDFECVVERILRAVK